MYQSSASEKINGRIELVMSTQAPAASNWSALMRSHVSLAVEVLAGTGNRSCRRCHSAPSECRCELMALVLLHHTVKCCSNLSEAKMAAQALISHSVQLSSLEDSVDVCALKAKCMTQVCVNRAYYAVSWESFAGALCFSHSLVSGFSRVFSMNKIPLILYYFIKSLISD